MPDVHIIIVYNYAGGGLLFDHGMKSLLTNLGAKAIVSMFV